MKTIALILLIIGAYTFGTSEIVSKSFAPTIDTDVSVQKMDTHSSPKLEARTEPLTASPKAVTEVAEEKVVVESPVPPPNPMPVNNCSLTNKYNWDKRIAYAVCMAESGGDVRAYNPEWHKDAYGNNICQGSFGLMQISCHGGQLWDPEANMAAAWAKYQERGWKPWGAFTSGKYLKHM